MGAGKSIFKGAIKGLITLVLSIIVPMLLFKQIKDIPDIVGLEISLENTEYLRILFWISAIGMISVAFSFAKGSSPKRSKRRALFGIGGVLANCFYIYQYKFSGASTFTMQISDLGTISVDLGVILNFWMGLIFLKIIIEIYDLFDAIFYKKKKKVEILEQTIPADQTTQSERIETQSFESHMQGKVEKTSEESDIDFPDEYTNKTEEDGDN